MKKLRTLLVLCFSMILAFTACSKKNNESKDNNTEPTPTPAVSEDDNKSEPLVNPVVREDYDFNDYIKLGTYKGLEIEAETLKVSDEDIDIAIQTDLHDNEVTAVEVTDRPVQMGDTVTIDFVGYHNGEAFDGGSSEDYELTIGSGTFIEGFEEQIVGAKANDEIDVNVVFPEVYSNAELAGEPALFKVTVKKIQYFELTDEVVKDLGYDTVEAYRDSIRQELEDNMQQKKKNYLYNTVIKGSEITLPDNLLEYYVNDYKIIYENMASAYNMDLETLVSISGYSMEQFEAEASSYANSMATRELITKAICAAEGIELTEEEINEYVSQLAEEYGYESNEEFLKAADIEMIKEDMLFDKVIDIIVANSVEI